MADLIHSILELLVVFYFGYCAWAAYYKADWPKAFFWLALYVSQVVLTKAFPH